MVRNNSTQDEPEPWNETQDDEHPAPTDKGKGKRRAYSPIPSERTPLLGSTSASRSSTYLPTSSVDSSSNDHLSHADPPSRRSLRSKLTLVFVSTLLLSLLALAILAALAYSYAARVSRLDTSELVERSLVVRGPDYVSVTNLTAPSDTPDHRPIIWMKVNGRAGIDAAAALGVQDDESPENPDSLHTYLWKALGRWGVRRMGMLSVEAPQIRILSDSGHKLADIDSPATLEIPLTSTMHSPGDVNWLGKVSVPVRVRPTDNGDDIIKFVRQSWSTGFLALKAEVPDVKVTGGGSGWGGWRKSLQLSRSNVVMALRKQIPTIPGMPTPGRDAPMPDMSRLITLISFNLTSIPHGIAISAQATLPNPTPDFVSMIIPSLPFTVFLPSSNLTAPPIPLASVLSDPLSLSTHPNLTISLHGHLLPLPAPAPGQNDSTLSAFLARYLSGQASNITISTPLYPAITLDTLFPAPDPPPRVLRDVQLKELKVRPHGTEFVASGMVEAKVVLPRGMRFDLSVRRLLPDVLVFDGPVPGDDSDLTPSSSYNETGHSRVSTMDMSRPLAPGDDTEPAPPAPPLPNPIPEGAFAHIRPEHWLPALSLMLPDEDEGTTVAVSARIADVPLQILPGREKVASDFFGKVVWGRGALAGLQGTVAVTARVEGLPIVGGEGEGGEIELSGLPFKGSVRIGGRN